MNKIIVLGAFGYDNNQLDGQTVKTRNLFTLLQENYVGEIIAIDTIHIRNYPLSVFKLIFNIITCNTLLIVPCLNNLTYIFPVMYWLSKIFRFHIIHICIGGWQAEYFQGNHRYKPHKLQLRQSKKIKAFLPEMVAVENDLRERFGFNNVRMFPNFRFISENVKYKETSSKQLRLVFLARIDKRKGYDTIFNFAKLVREKGYNIRVDFYGPVNSTNKEEFFQLVNNHNDIVRYNGVIQQNVVTATLQNYDVMLLPTTIYTEGFPGSILDAYIAGIPVIVTEWKYSHEFVDNGETGYIVPFENSQDKFNEKILTLYEDRNLLSRMKQSSFIKRLSYSDKKAWSILEKFL